MLIWFTGIELSDTEFVIELSDIIVLRRHVRILSRAVLCITHHYELTRLQAKVKCLLLLEKQKIGCFLLRP